MSEEKVKIELDSDQKAVINAIDNYEKNIIVNAKAGSGKTTLIFKAIERIINDYKKILYVTFNRSVVEESLYKAEKKYGLDMKKLNITTYHSLGLSMIMNQFKINPKINDDKYEEYLSENIVELSEGLITPGYPGYRSIFRNIIELCNLSRYNLAQIESEISMISQNYGINTCANEISVVEKMMEWGMNNIQEIDFTDMVWIAAEQCDPCKKFIYDYIFVDEVQDSSPAQQKLIEKCYGGQSRILMVGDINQTINAWCGADVSSFDNLKRRYRIDNEMDIRISHRCSKNVIKLAQTIVKDIIPAPEATDGYASESPDFLISDIKKGSMVLCRLTEPLIRLYFILLRDNKKVKIRGRDIAKSMLDKIKVKDSNKKLIEKISKDFNEEGLVPILYYDLYMSLLKRKKDNPLSFESFISSEEFLSSLDAIKSIIEIGYDIDSTEELKTRINLMFPEDKKPSSKDEITLSTIHKAKGLEADYVFLICPNTWISPFIDKNDKKAMQGEMNVKYVSITRAKEEFKVIMEKEISVNKYWGNIAYAKKEIENVKPKLEALYGELPDLFTSDSIITQVKKHNYSVHITPNEMSQQAGPVISDKKGKNKPKFMKFVC